MFGAAISELSYSEIQELAVGKTIWSTIYFNSDTLNFPPTINRIAEFSMEINKEADFSAVR